MSQVIYAVARAVRGSIFGRWSTELRFVRSDFLVGQPSFFSGVARTIDLGGVFDDYNKSLTPAAADARALYADWRVIGQDLLASARSLYPDFPSTPSIDADERRVSA